VDNILQKYNGIIVNETGPEDRAHLPKNVVLDGNSSHRKIVLFVWTETELRKSIFVAQFRKIIVSSQNHMKQSAIYPFPSSQGEDLITCPESHPSFQQTTFYNN
jgi:hypothetical protein